MQNDPTGTSYDFKEILLKFVPPELELLVQNFDLELIKNSGTSIKKLAHQAALGNYLTYDTLSLTNATQFDDVKNLFEASYHARMLKCWDLAYILMCWPVGADQTSFHEQLEKWGAYRQQIELYRGVYEQIDDAVDLLCLNGMGKAYRLSGNFEMSIFCHQSQLDLAQKISNVHFQMLSYQGLGQVYYDWAKSKSGIEYFKKQLALAQALKDVPQQVHSLCMLGRACINEMMMRQGINYLKNALRLAKSIDDEDVNNLALSHLAYGYSWVGNTEKASVYLKQLVQRLSNNKESLIYITSIQSLGQISIFHGDSEQANLYLNEALDLIQKSHMPILTIRAFSDLALFYNQCEKKHELAINFENKAMAESQRIGHVRYIMHGHAYLAIFYADMGKFDEANTHIQEVLSLYKSYPDLMSFDQKLMRYACFSKVKWESGRYLHAIFIALQGAIACPPWKSINGRWVLRETIKTIVQPFKNKLNQLKTKIGN